MGKVVSIDVEVAFDVVLVHASQREVGEHYVQLSQERYVREAQCRSVWLIDRDANAHPRNIAYQAPAAARAVAHAVEHPGCIVGAFAALALHGLPFLVDAADTTLYCTTDRTRHADECAPAVRRPSRSMGPVVTMSHRGVKFRAMSAAAALVQALQMLRRGEHRWYTEPIAGLEPLDVMAVQLVDCARRHLGLVPVDIREAARRRVDASWLDNILALSSSHADSPKETELRLMLRAVTEEFDVNIQEQVPLRIDGRLLTVFDLAIPELKIGVMYDGAHHWEHDKRQKDARINLVASREGWVLLRCASASMVEMVPAVRAVVAERIQK